MELRERQNKYTVNGTSTDDVCAAINLVKRSETESRSNLNNSEKVVNLENGSDPLVVTTTLNDLKSSDMDNNVKIDFETCIDDCTEESSGINADDCVVESNRDNIDHCAVESIDVNADDCAVESTNVNADDCAVDSHEVKTGDHNVEVDKELTDSINVSIEDESNNIDDNTVTLRRSNKKITFSTDDDDEEYRYWECVSTKSGTSKRMVEIGKESQISDDDLRLAATLVHDAMEGRTVDIKTEPKYVRSYNHFKSWPLTYLLYVTLVVDLSLVIFEEPAMEEFSLSYVATTCIEVVCLIYFTARTCHHYHWRSKKKFFRDLKNIIIIGIIFFTIVDIIVYVIRKQVECEEHCIRYTRSLRALLIVNFSDGRQIRRAWRNMRKTVFEIAHVLLLFFFFIMVFGLIAYQIFRYRSNIVYPDGKQYFKSYGAGVWDLYVLVTTSNHPEVMVPAIDQSKFYCIFFFVYIMVCFYMLLNVLLAVAYHSYNSNLKDEIKRSSWEKKRKLGQAFDVIKVNYKSTDMVTYRTWKRLMYLVKPTLSKNQIDLLMLILDMDRSGHIGRREFMNVADLLNVPVSEVEDRITVFEKVVPTLYNSVAAEYVKTFVDSIAFVIIYDVIVVLEVILIACDVSGINKVFCALFILEILLKMFTRGLVKYMKKMSNWFDLIVTTSSFIVLIVSSVGAVQENVDHEIITALVIVRIFRILRLIIHIKRFKIIADTLVNISMSILIYGGILFIIVYVFAIVGMELFKGKISNHGYGELNDTSKMYCGAPQLQNSSFYESRYCSLNFNDFVSSVLILASVLFQNNWHILTEGYSLVAGVIARIYFAIFFLSVSVVVMNIVTAFFVDMFMYEYTIQKEGKADSVVEKKIKELGLGIDAETGLEISAPLSDTEMQELLQDSGEERPQEHPWIQKSTLRGFRNADLRFSGITSLVNKRKSSMPTLNRFDGIRFHIKKSGWTKIEVLLQQLYDVETDVVT
ncbi:Two pore calcium channel protein 1-like [Mactra antiquata]